MKKVISLLVMAMLCVSLMACGNQNGSENAKTADETAVKEESSAEEAQAAEDAAQAEEGTGTETAESEAAEDTVTENDEDMQTEMQNESRMLVAYFSVTGNTRGMAESIADGLEADLYEIVPEEPYTEADLNYNDNNSRTTLEMNDSSARPEISGTIEHFDQYDTIFLGYPIWWGEAPRILDTFVESYDFTGKTVIPFCTSASSGIGSSADTLEGLAGSGTWLDGQRFSGSDPADKVLEWAGQFK